MKSLDRLPARAAAGGLLLAGAAALALIRWNEAGIEGPPVAPPPPPQPLPPAPLPAATPAPAPTADGLRLHGLLGRGAIIGDSRGRQSFFAIGREIRPGLRVARIEQSHVVLAAAGAELRLGFDGAAQPIVAPAASAVSPSNDSDAALREDTIAYRIGLAPRRAGDRTAGYVVRPSVPMPALERAGLRPGDVILGVNGSAFDEERMLELAWQMAHSDRTRFEIERGGRRIQLE
ncbi:hypothetical protein [Sphingosinicella terrae]|uniref:hypothetical protein n=1 Tax=Sphingosinicella terrae TaxID=2172047 RepID=UPI000E0D5E13|nr:hypothetical protein [Sphingosinicella terrae]